MGRSLRFRYGHGVGRVALSVPDPGLETVPLRPSREVIASILPLALAVCLPLGALLTNEIERWPGAASLPSPVVVVRYSIDDDLDRVVPRPAIDKENLEPAEPLAAYPDSITQVAGGQVQPSPAPAIADPVTRVLPAIQIDGLDPVQSPKLAVVVRRIPGALIAKPSRSGSLASEFARVTRDAPPIGLPPPARVDRAVFELPAVSLPGPAWSAPLEGLDGLATSSFRARLGTPTAPRVASLPEPVASGMSRQLLHPVSQRGAGRGHVSGGVVGVPLEALAACRSRAREDTLKQQLMLAVTNGSQCTARGGTYSFLETKNLNAFLMRVTRDSDRELGNRCDELKRAQVCVSAQRVAGVQP